MALEDTGLKTEIDAIIALGPKPVHNDWTCQFTAGEDVLSPLKILGIDIERLYNEQYGDRIFLEVAFGMGTYNHRLYPFRDNLMVTLIRTPTEELGVEERPDDEVVVKTYRAVLIQGRSETLENNGPAAESEEAGNLTDIRAVRFQLVDPALEQIRLRTVGGVYRRVTTLDVLRQVLTQASAELEVEEEFAIKGVDAYPADNTQLRDHVIIPHGTPLVEVPFHLQEHAGGIYNAGLGYYLQDGIWYVYPEWRLDRFASTPRTLTVINIPANRFPNLERTYRTTANQVVVLSTGEVVHGDSSEALQQNQGNGVRFTDATKVMEGFSTTTNNRTRIQRRDNNTEYVAHERKTGLNNTPVAPEGQSANPFSQASRLARRKGSFLQVQWENSEWGLLYPGMPVKFLYYENNVVRESEGVLVQTQHFIQATHPGLVTGGYGTTSVLTLFVGNDFEWEGPERTEGETT